MRFNPPNITLRPCDSADEAFLFRLFRTANEYKFAPAGLDDQQLTQLLQIQFTAQERQYASQYEDGDFQIVLANGAPIGRLYVWRGTDEIVIVDVTILPEQQNGIGAALVREVLREGDRSGKPVRAHVERVNRAWQLWLRVGFEIVGDDGVYLALEKLPGRDAVPRRREAAGPAAAAHESSQPAVH